MHDCQASLKYQNFYLDSNSTIRWQRVQGGSNQTYVISSSGHITANAWNHVALVRGNSTYYLFVNGTNRADSINNPTYSFGELGAPCWIGRGNVGTGFFHSNGYVDEFRFSKGTARWTSNFTPLDSEYSSADISGTLTEEARIVILDENSWEVEHNSVHSAGAFVIPEGSGSGLKTVTAYPTDTNKNAVIYRGITPVS